MSADQTTSSATKRVMQEGAVDAISEPQEKRAKKQVRIWVDGCFDMMHFGHANALRQAREMGDYLVVGVHNDEDILKNKGPTVMKEQERYAMVRACKWVDEVVEAAPYVTQLDVMDKYDCDFCVHGDDITTTADGKDAYHLVKAAGRYKECKRTQGVSTTDLVGRMLLATRVHHTQHDEAEGVPVSTLKEMDSLRSAEHKVSPYTGNTQFLATTQKLIQFSNNKSPKPDDVIGYLPGSFDLFHTGHLELLVNAKKQCDYLLVGLLSDHVVNKLFGGNYPIMNLHERTLMTLACRHCDEVVMGAPAVITEELLNHFNISKVFRAPDDVEIMDGVDRFKHAKDKGIFVPLKIENTLETKGIIDRIIANRMEYEARNAKKQAKELKLIESQSKAETK